MVHQKNGKTGFVSYNMFRNAFLMSFFIFKNVSNVGDTCVLTYAILVYTIGIYSCLSTRHSERHFPVASGLFYYCCWCLTITKYRKKLQLRVRISIFDPTKKIFADRVSWLMAARKDLQAFKVTNISTYTICFLRFFQTVRILIMTIMCILLYIYVILRY